MRGKELLRPQRKFYPRRQRFSQSRHGFQRLRFDGAQLEGIVFMELQRRGYDVTIGSLPDGEIDFIAKRGNDKQYIQVTLNMTEEQARERELARCGDWVTHSRTVLTLDWHSEGMTDEGIHITNVMDWLCS